MRQQQLTSPDQAWQEIERVVLNDPAVGALYGAVQVPGDAEGSDTATRALHDRIAVAAKQIWLAVAVCGRNHVLGETGRVFGFEVHPDAVGRQTR